MEKIKVKGKKDGKNIEIEISKIILGASDYLRVDNIEYAEKIINRYAEVGGNCFDTAHHYRYSDQAIGEYFKRNGNREQFVLFAKGCHPVREYPHIPRVNKQGIIDDVNASLSKLGVEYLDLFALHRDDTKVPVSEIIDTLNNLIISGKIHAIGTSNWTLERIIEANEYAEANELIGFTFNSPNLSLAKPQKQRWPNCISADEDMVNWHQKNQIPLLSWSAQASGFLSGEYHPDNQSNSEMVECFYNRDNWQRLERTEKLANELDVHPITISLAWVINQAFPTAAIIGPEKIEELDQSLEALKLKIDKDTYKALDLKSNKQLDEKIALQLYSVRNQLEEDMAGTLKKIAKMGYKYVQMDGYRGNNMFEFKRELENNKLTVVGMHFKHSRFFDDLDGIIKEALLFGCKNIYDKYIDEEEQNKLGYVNTKNKLIEVSQKLSYLGFHVGLHNPEYDFNQVVKGQPCMDYICSPENGILIYPELDTYWITVAGKSIIEYINSYKNQIDLIHCKDIDLNYDLSDLENNLVACGKGSVDFKEVIKHGELANVKYYVVEQDCDNKQDIMVSIEESLTYLKNIGMEVLNA